MPINAINQAKPSQQAAAVEQSAKQSAAGQAELPAFLKNVNLGALTFRTGSVPEQGKLIDMGDTGRLWAGDTIKIKAHVIEDSAGNAKRFYIETNRANNFNCPSIILHEWAGPIAVPMSCSTPNGS